MTQIDNKRELYAPTAKKYPAGTCVECMKQLADSPRMATEGSETCVEHTTHVHTYSEDVELSQRTPLELDTLEGINQRIVNRSNRLQRLKDLDAPDVIVKQSEALLHQAINMLWAWHNDGLKPSEWFKRFQQREAEEEVSGP